VPVLFGGAGKTDGSQGTPGLFRGKPSRRIRRKKMDRYQCRCQYVYDPEKGDETQGIPPGTSFADLPDTWVCPLCGLAKSFFVKEVGKPTSEQGHPTIKVRVKCFSTLRKADICDFKESTEHELPDGSTVHDLVEKLDIPLDAVKIVFVNNTEVNFETVLRNDDQIALSPKTGAM
jgi:rubredoxin/molybdopterin converting factor small subunit